ncbi:hypothetical protein AB0K93_07770 [Streptomyces sp. NPDC052676]|uniref:hypothetical protein n=1 Tax=Streptomyces sp. NPDC052676 TaxID=3154953 RepID=UPI0034345B44
MDSLESLLRHLEDIATRAEDLAKSPNLDDDELHDVHSLWDTAIAALQDLGVAYTQRDGTHVLAKPERPARWRILLGLVASALNQLNAEEYPADVQTGGELVGARMRWRPRILTYRWASAPYVIRDPEKGKKAARWVVADLK